MYCIVYLLLGTVIHRQKSLAAPVKIKSLNSLPVGGAPSLDPSVYTVMPYR